jgi:hypothetical protein
MHTEKKEYKKEKSRYSDQIIIAAVLTSPRQRQKSSISKSDASKKKTVHKHHRRPITNLRVRPGESPRSYNKTFNKTIAKHNQLRLDLGFSA